MSAEESLAVAEAVIPRVESRLESVVVHSAGAVCTRRARHVVRPAPDGTARIRLTGLPVALFQHSLRARVLRLSGDDPRTPDSGPAGLRVTDVRFGIDVVLQQAEELPQLRQDLTEAEERQQGLRDRRDRLAAEIQEVAGIRAVPPQPRRGDPPRWAPVESLLALATFVDNRLARLQDRLRVAEDELRQADHDTELLRHRLAVASGALHTSPTQTSGTAMLTLDQVGLRATELEIELEYHVPGAAWVPVYQLRLGRSFRTDGNGAGTLVLRACVAQRTGEDWTGVRLGLSTADLWRRADLPELRSLRIGRRQEEPPAPGWREPPDGLGELFTGYDAAVAARSAVNRTGAALRSVHAAAGHEELESVDGAAPVAPPAPAALIPGHAPVEPSARGRREPPDGPGEAFASYRYAGYGAPDTYGAAPGGPPPPSPVPVSRGARAERASAPLRAAMPQAGAGPAAPPPPPAAALSPAEDLLDYSRLTLTGPEDPALRGKLGPIAGADPLVAEYRRRAEGVARLGRPKHAVDVRRSAGSFDYRFDTAALVDVAADGTWHTVPVCEIPVELTPEYVCVPAVDEAVYGTVLLSNTSGHALLAGPADVTVNGDFLMTVPLPTLAPGERRRVGLGVVESISVARRTRMHESSAGLRAGTTVLDHHIEVEIANRLTHPAVIEVRERVPVSHEKDVRIEEHPASPPWAAVDEPQDDDYLLGGRLWRVRLEPGRTASLTGGYQIRVPAGRALVGGNRRD